MPPEARHFVYWDPGLRFAKVKMASTGTILSNRVIAPISPGATNPGTTAGDYIVTVTATDGATTATTAVSVTVK